MKIYILMASQGEYSDREETPVKAYLTREKAEAALLKADEEERVHRYKHSLDNDYCINPDDPWFEETTYFINEVELEE